MTSVAPARPMARPAYAQLRLYAPDRTPARVDLSDNTNRWGMPPAAARAVRDASSESCTRYPDTYAAPLKESLAGYCGVDPSCIVTGCGSDDVLDSAIRAFGEPGERLATCDPSFAMLPAFARMNGLEPVIVPLTDTFDLDVAALRAAGPRVLYLCTPNNPTGTVASRERVEAIVDDTDAVVIIDEAYAEFAVGHLLELARTRPNVLIVRTMSKAFGLAGLRVGYAVGAPALVAEVEKSRGPYKVSAIAARAAIAALRDDAAWVRDRVMLARDARNRLQRELGRRGIPALPSAANFVLAPMRDADAVARLMRERGVAVRPFTDLPLLSPMLRDSRGAALRITVGPPDQMTAALDALDAARAACA
jgi:histidinol-phosphate aminotransferase